jgi:outer membrane immunogenic protein
MATLRTKNAQRCLCFLLRRRIAVGLGVFSHHQNLVLGGVSMKRHAGWVAGSVLSLVTFGSALAADLPVKAPYTKAPVPPPVYNWTGAYVGGNIGWGDSRGGNGESCLNSGTGTSFGCAIIPDAGLRASGALGGGQFGYNWQNGMWVFGLEGDLQASHIKGESLIPGPFAQVGVGPSGPGSFYSYQNMDWFGTARGRVGYAFNNVLLYGTGGVMYADLQTKQSLAFPGIAPYANDSNSIRAGWVAGGGVEWGVLANLSLKAEALYYDLGHVTTAGVETPPNAFTDFKTFGFHGVLARVGFNYHLDTPVVAKY